MSLNESIVKDAAFEWFHKLGYVVGPGPHLTTGETVTEQINANQSDPHA